jgi:hypothetical protein
VVESEVELVAADRHLPERERRIEGIGTLQLRWISLHEKDSINAEAF